MSLTMPTPPGAERASMWAARIDSVARENAVRKPKLWSMNGMSLSIVFGTPTTAMRSPRCGDHAGDLLRAVQRAVAADHEQDVDAHLLEAVDDLLRVLAAARAAEDRAAVLVDAAHDVGVELHDLVPVAGDEALVAVAEAEDPAHAVVARELHHQAADDVVEPGAETAAGDDARRASWTGRRRSCAAGRRPRSPAAPRRARRGRRPGRRCRRAARGRSRPPSDASCGGCRAARPAASRSGTRPAS